MKLFLTAGLLMFGCAQNNNPELANNYFDKQGHRGCRGLMPENSIPAMYQAIDLGVTTLEMDVVFTLDDQAVLSHEPFFNHEITTRPNGKFVDTNDERSLNIYKMNYEEVAMYDVGSKGHQGFPKQKKLHAIKPRLADVFDQVQKYCQAKKVNVPDFNIETKTTPATDNIFHPDPQRFVDMLMKIIIDHEMKSKVTIQSFDIRTLQYLKKKYPDVSTSLLTETPGVSLQERVKQLGFTPTIFSPHYMLVNDQVIRTCHEMNMKVIPWTVNNLQSIKRLKKMGVDGIISDYPDLFLKL